MDYTSLLMPFPFVLWLTGTALFGLSFLPRLDWLRTTALVVGILGSVLGYVSLRQHWVEARLSAAQISDFRAAANFFLVAWSVAGVIHALRHRFFPAWSIPGWAQGLFMVGMLLGAAYLLRASRSDVPVFGVPGAEPGTSARGR